ncbi:MAG: histidine kinase [Bacteroidota bacterium]
MAAFFKSTYNHKKELLLFVFTNGPACILFNWLFLGNRYFNDGKLFFIATLAIFPFILLLHNTMSGIGRYIGKKFPLYSDTLKRNLYTSLASFINAMFFILAAVFFYQLVPMLRFEVTFTLVRTIALVVLVINMVIGSIYMAMYVFDQMKKTLVQNESLKKEQLQQQFDSLKTKVNPHFLFNALSSLSTLVSEDTEKADEFLNEMSKVYRYMLKSNHFEMVTLQQEVAFIHSYFYLQQVRYGKAVAMQVTVSEKYNDYLLPPLTLQLLLENVFQHNTTLKELPLHIKIETNNNDTITVKNTLRQKKISVSTGGKRLLALEAKFSLPGFAVNETPDEFMVTIPLTYHHDMQTGAHEK